MEEAKATCPFEATGLFKGGFLVPDNRFECHSATFDFEFLVGNEPEEVLELESSMRLLYFQVWNIYISYIFVIYLT